VVVELEKQFVYPLATDSVSRSSISRVYFARVVFPDPDGPVTKVFSPENPCSIGDKCDDREFMSSFR